MKRITPLCTLMSASSLALLLAAGPVLAQPSDNPGRGQGAAPGDEARRMPPGQQKQPQEARQEHDRRDDGYRDRDRHTDDGHHRDRRGDDRPIVDEREVRRIFTEHRDWIHPDEHDSLPPGIRMNLERGKPLPPGIAKRFDDRLHHELPYYDGYEWRRVGPDAILVDAANEIIYAIIRDILY